MQRYDTVTFVATKTDEGFIRDSPIVGRTGILIYQNADGTERREYRPPEEAFKADSLNSLLGKPITIGHKAMVTSKNAGKVNPVGTVLSEGRQDGNAIRADIVIYNLDTAARELSCGYSLTTDETPGTTPEGERYDAIQRNIVYNHIAVVPKGRAGIARLNMDGEQEFNFAEETRKEEENMESKMTKIRLDGGLEYDAAPEVGVHIEKLNGEIAALKNDVAEANKAKDTLQAKYDAAVADNDKLKADAKKAAEEAAKKFDAAVKARVNLLEVAAKHKIDKADSVNDMTDKEIKIAIIKAVRGGKLNLDGKSDDYIEAAYDMAKDETENRSDNMAGQREKLSGKGENSKDNHEDESDPNVALKKLMDEEAKAYLKEVK